MSSGRCAEGAKVLVHKDLCIVREIAVHQAVNVLLVQSALMLRSHANDHSLVRHVLCFHRLRSIGTSGWSGTGTAKMKYYACPTESRWVLQSSPGGRG
uniref:Uncharacterized protein n=1 Tax=Parascaris equorum TaxID=6256 RepID=A0A914R4C8_PAREQ